MRVYELARELGVETREVIGEARRLGVEATSPLSGVDDESADLLRRAITGVGPTRDSLPVEPRDESDWSTRSETQGAKAPASRLDRNRTERPGEGTGEPHSWGRSPGDVRIDHEYYFESRKKGLFESGVLVLIVVYLVLNRAIPDRFVLPFGASVRLYELILMLTLGAWVLWMVVDPRPFPTGLLGLTGLGLLLSLGLAPFMSALNMTPFQADGAQRGLVRLFLFAGLFLASYHLAFRLRAGRVMLYWVLGLTATQALFSVWEFLTETPLFLFDNLATSIGLIPDPSSIRAEFDLFVRLTGEVRAVGTAPHPIVLSAVVALGLLISAGWMVNEEGNKGRKWLIVVTAALVLGLPVTNSRTGFVIIVAAAIPLLALSARNLVRAIPWGLSAALVFIGAFVISPQTPRLLLNSFTNPDADPNTQVRIERFARIPELIEDRPFVGAGYLTHDPAIQIFDNAYNLALVETGIIGLTLFVALFVLVLVRSWSAYRLASAREAVLPFAGVAAAIAVLVGGATFDAWTFDQFFPTALIIMGLGSGRSAVIRRRATGRQPATALTGTIR